MPPDYLITLIEGLTTLCHYCLLECPAPVLSPLNQPPLPPVPSQPYAPGTSASQIISNLIHVFSTSSNQKVFLHDFLKNISICTYMYIHTLVYSKKLLYVYYKDFIL